MSDKMMESLERKAARLKAMYSLRLLTLVNEVLKEDEDRLRSKVYAKSRLSPIDRERLLALERIEPDTLPFLERIIACLAAAARPRTLEEKLKHFGVGNVHIPWLLSNLKDGEGDSAKGGKAL
jgi:hypothetical protein